MPGVTRCKHDEIGAEAELPTDALDAWKARGWEPISDSRSRHAAEVERVDAENAAAQYDKGGALSPASTPHIPRATPVTRPTGTTAGDAGKNKEK